MTAAWITASRGIIIILMSEQIIRQVFEKNGTLATHVAGYSARSQQLEMALAIADAIENNTQLVAEAGTGTGKTFAYLVPPASKAGTR